MLIHVGNVENMLNVILFSVLYPYRSYKYSILVSEKLCLQWVITEVHTAKVLCSQNFKYVVMVNNCCIRLFIYETLYKWWNDE